MIVNGWTIYFHPLFLDQLERLKAGVERDGKKHPDGLTKGPKTKLLSAIRTITLGRIPQDPTNARYRLGTALGDGPKHWFRDKFGNGRFRLFFRYNASAKIIIYVWINDETTLRTYGAKSDAYAVFASMLHDGTPPDSRDKLLTDRNDPEINKRTAEFSKKN